MLGREGETLSPGWIPCCCFSVSGLDVAPAGRGRDQCWVCAGPVSPSASPNPGVSPRKRHPQLHNHQPATHPSPLGKDWEEGRIFQPVCAAVFSFPHPGPAVPLGFLSLAPSARWFFPARWFFLLGNGDLLGDEVLGENVLTSLGFSGWNLRCRFPLLRVQPCWGFGCALTVKYFGIWGKQTDSWSSVPCTRLRKSWNCGLS